VNAKNESNGHTASNSSYLIVMEVEMASVRALTLSDKLLFSGFSSKMNL